MAKIYDPVTSNDAEIAINTREYTLYLRELQEKFGFDLSVFFMPISYQWWTRYLKYIVVVREKPNKMLGLVLSKKKIEDIVKNGVEYSTLENRNMSGSYYDESADIYNDDGFDEEIFDESAVTQERPNTSSSGTKTGLLQDLVQGNGLEILRSTPIDSYDSNDADFNVLQSEKNDMNKSVFLANGDFGEDSLPPSARGSAPDWPEKLELIPIMAELPVETLQVLQGKQNNADLPLSQDFYEKNELGVSLIPDSKESFVSKEISVENYNDDFNSAWSVEERASVKEESVEKYSDDLDYALSVEERASVNEESVDKYSNYLDYAVSVEEGASAKDNSVEKYNDDFTLSIEEGTSVAIPFNEAVDKVLNAGDSDINSIGSSLGIFEDLSESDAQIPGPVESLESSLNDGYISDGFEDES